MLRVIKKYTLPIAITVLLTSLISCSAIVSGIHRGHKKTAVNINESISAVSQNCTDSVSNMLKSAGIKNVFLPDKYNDSDNNILSVKTDICKKYTQCTVTTKTGIIEVREYNYAYLVEDEVIKIPDNAEKINKDKTDIFIFENSDDTSTAIYYSGLTRYIITENCTRNELIMTF